VTIAVATSLLVTVCVYLTSERIDRRFRAPWSTPVGFSVVVLAAWVATGTQSKGVDLAAYALGTRPLTLALGPGVVALGWLAYTQRRSLRRAVAPLVAGVLAGTVTSLASTTALAAWLGADPRLAKALGLKAVTSPVAFEVARGVGVDPALTVPFVIATGIFGAVLGPALLRVLPGRYAPAIGIAVGTACHGIGTAGLAGRGHGREAALSGLAMAMAAVTTSALAPWTYAWIARWLGT
jgi:putative effector of murein hydrolase